MAEQPASMNRSCPVSFPLVCSLYLFLAVQPLNSESESDSEPEPEQQTSKRVVHEPDELQDNDSDDEDQSRKKRAPNADRDFQLVAEWSREEMDDETILVHI